MENERDIFSHEQTEHLKDRTELCDPSTGCIYCGSYADDQRGRMFAALNELSRDGDLMGMSTGDAFEAGWNAALSEDKQTAEEK